ncbi:uncharacterized protein [Paramisgurnus dabryanus]|uniref:uncharacterized protein n=1 Tax=Paramisgurnus dabryanus TaxID=90735 RepID=UPI0031F39469
MEPKRFTISITLVYVLFFAHQKVFGIEVKIRVKPGDNVTLYCDCVIPLGSHIFWMRNSSYGNQSSLLLSAEELFNENLPRFNFVPNSSSNSYDLHIKNISVDDEGIYYCAKAERNIATVHGMLEYQYGNRRTHLTVFDRLSTSTETPSPTPQYDHHLKMMPLWMPPVILCLVCVLICLCCLYRRKKKTDFGARMLTKSRHDEGEREVYYASLNRTSLQQKQLRDKRLSNSDFSTYSQLRIK